MPRSNPRSKREEEAHRLRRLRELLGLSQRELAQDFKVAHGAIGLWENGERTIPGPVLKLMELYEEELGMSGSTGRKEGGIKKLHTNWISRSLKVSTTTAGITARLAAGQLQKILSSQADSSQLTVKTQEALARQVVGSMGELKGLMMKIGQMVSYMDFALPEAAREAFSTLQSSSTPMAPSVVADVLLKEFGKTPRQLFAEWSAYPFAAASIGQVHRATLHSGEEVAVKIQYPGIAKTFHSDLTNAAIVDKLGSFIFRGQEPGQFLAELRERLMEECDYALEATNQETFRELYKDNRSVRIPKVYRELSTPHVLTTEFIRAQSFKDFTQTASEIEKSRAGEIIWRMAFESIFRHGLFNGDPHPGNYLFSDGQVIFLDFGCVKRFPPELVQIWRAFLRAVLEEDAATANRLWIEMGMVPDPETYDFDYQLKMVRNLNHPWLSDRPFRFSQDYVTGTWRSMMVENKNKFRANLPKDWVFTLRLQWGVCAILASLNAEANWHRMLKPLVYDSAHD